MTRVLNALAILSLAALAACQNDPIENVQAEAENQSQRLESRANEITAEAENGVAASELTLENQAAALLNEAEPADNASANQSGNVQ